MNELGLMTDELATVSRGYVQWWLNNETPPEQEIRQIFRGADVILKAGRVTPSEPTI